MPVVALPPAAMVAAADAVFCAERGRAGSVAERWPGLFGADAAGRCFAVMENGIPVSGLLAQPVRWLAGGTEHVAHAVGFVFTRAEARGRGLASMVLRATAEQVPGALVLWTGRPDFYAANGWQPGDDGSELLEWTGAPAAETGTAAVPLAQADIAALERVRAAWTPRRLLRDHAQWRARPFGAETMLVAAGNDAHVLFGRSGDHAVVHDMVGPPQAIAALWPTIAAGCRRVSVNLWRDHPARPWLTGTLGLTPVAKPLACWLRWPEAERWPFPWFDRI